MPRTPLRPDLDAAKKQAKFSLGSGRELILLEDMLAPDEGVEAMIQCRYEGCFGLAVLTGTRLLFVCDGFIWKSVDEFALERIGAVQWQTVFGIGALRFHVEGTVLEFSGIYGPSGPAMVKGLREHLADRDRVNVQARDSLIALAAQFVPAPEPTVPDESFRPAPAYELLPQP